MRLPTGRRIELVSTFSGEPQRNGYSGAPALPLLGTSDPLKLRTTKVQETALDGHMTVRPRTNTPVDNNGYCLLDPQSTNDYWEHYLTAAAEATAMPGKTNGHGSTMASR